MHRFRILYIEDNPLDFRLVHELFKENKSFLTDLENASTLKEGLKKIQKERYDLIILDLNLSDSMGVETFEAFRDVINYVPLILLTGLQDEELAVELLKKGAQDYLTKSDINSYNLSRAIIYSIERSKLINTISSDLENRKRMEAQLHFQSSILVNVNDAVITTNKNFEVTFWNNVAEIFYGWKKEEVIGKNPDIILKTTQINTDRNLRSTFGNLTNLTRNLILQTKKNGEQVFIERNEFVLNDENKKITGYGSVNRDVTNKVKVEQELIKQNSILDAIFNNSHSIVIFLLDKNYCYLTFNRNHINEMKNVYGIDIKIGMNMLDLITNPEIKLKAKESYDRVLAGESFVEIQFQPELNIYYEFHWNSVKREKTDIFGLSCFVINITDRKRAEESLRKSEEKFKSIYEGSYDAIMLLNEKGFFDCNPQALKMFGINNKEEFIKLNPSDLSPPNQTDGKNSFESSNEKIHTAYQQGINRFDWIHRRSNDEDFPAEVLLSVFNLGSEQVLQATVRDISERKRAEKELIEAKDHAEEMNHLKNCFLSNMSHELRTPLISVLGFAELLQQELKDPEQLEFVKNIMEGGQRLNNTLTEILEISKLEATESFSKKRSCNLADEIKEIVKSFLPMAQSKGLFLRTELKDTNLNAQIDSELFGKTLFHLVSNGIKFTNEGGILVTLNHERKNDKDWAVTKVRDTGIGISKENIYKIFNEFKQVSEGYKRSYEGTGLGITIAKRIAELMKGYIEVESEIGKGSVFSIWLPAVQSKKLIHHQIEEKKTTTIIKPPTTIEKGLQKVLVVDDNSSNRLFMNHILRSYVRIIEAEDGISGVTFASKEHFDLILMDINLGSGIDGVETMHQIKKIPGYADVPIIAVTAYAMFGDKERFLSEGFDNYLEKPFTKAILVDLVERTLAKEKNT